MRSILSVLTYAKGLCFTEEIDSIYTSSMERGLAFIQFIIIGLGVFALRLMVHLDGQDHPTLIGHISYFAARHGLWFFAVPILWAIFSTLMKGRINRKALEVGGIFLTILLLITFAIPLVYFLR